MSEIIRCPKCLGTKQEIGMGLMLKDCTQCGAVGYIEDEPRPRVEKLGDTVVKRKRKQKAA